MNPIHIAFCLHPVPGQASTYASGVRDMRSSLMRLLALAPRQSNNILVMESGGFEGFDMSSFEAATNAFVQHGLERSVVGRLWFTILLYWAQMIEEADFPTTVLEATSELRTNPPPKHRGTCLVSAELAKQALVQIYTGLRESLLRRYNQQPGVKTEPHMFPQLDEVVQETREDSELSLFRECPPLSAFICRLGQLVQTEVSMQYGVDGNKTAALRCAHLSETASSLGSFFRDRAHAELLRSLYDTGPDFLGVQHGGAHRLTFTRHLSRKKVPYKVIVPHDESYLSKNPIPLWELRPDQQERETLAVAMIRWLDWNDPLRRSYTLDLSELRQWYDSVMKTRARGQQEQRMHHRVSRARSWFLKRFNLPEDTFRQTRG